MFRQTPTLSPVDQSGMRAGHSREASSDVQIAHVAKAVGYDSVRRYKARCQFVFDGVPLRNKRVLDVGAGAGSLTFWAALHGASSVLALEPEADGSASGYASTLHTLTAKLGLADTIRISPAYLQDVAQLNGGTFDLVTLYDVINHLDEAAVASLPGEEAAQRYVSILARLRTVLAPGALVVVADCGRHNLWNHLGLRSPFASTIEWHKHQQPEIWTALFRRSGFELRDLRWSTIYPFGSASSHRLLQYAFSSHFVLRFRVTGADRQD